MESKVAIRAHVKQLKQGLSDDESKKFSQKIVNQLVYYTDWKTVKNLHIYQTIPRLKEVDSGQFIELLKNNYPQLNIYNPESEPGQLDTIIVPLVAFDASCNRLGHGGGYYDRFLKKYPKAKKIGLAFELQKLKEIPTEPHDVKLDAVVTEERIYTAKI